jgi:hypothetical protein
MFAWFVFIELASARPQHERDRRKRKCGRKDLCRPQCLLVADDTRVNCSPLNGSRIDF